MIRGAPIGRRFAHASLDNYEVTQFNRNGFEACQKVVRGETGGVVLRGPVGVGKTHLLIGLMKAFQAQRTAFEEEAQLVQMPPLREMVERASEEDVEGPPVRLDPTEQMRDPEIEYWPMLDLASELRAEVMQGELFLSRRCRLCDLLILDDLGREKLTDFILQEFQRIIDWRYRQEKPIAVATNRTPRELVERYGENAFSRWQESCEIAEITGPDYRTERP